MNELFESDSPNLKWWGIQLWVDNQVCVRGSSPITFRLTAAYKNGVRNSILVQYDYEQNGMR